MNVKNNKAFTLLEILVALFIFSVVMAAIYSAFLVGNRSWVVYNNNVDVQRQVRNTFIFMTKELREAKNIFITKEEGRVEITFTKSGEGFISYSFSRDGHYANCIVRAHESEKKVLANNLTSFSVEQMPRAVVIEIKAMKKPPFGPPSEFSLKEKVALRFRMIKS